VLERTQRGIERREERKGKEKKKTKGKEGEREAIDMGRWAGECG
jgi:hypothetical protein